MNPDRCKARFCHATHPPGALFCTAHWNLVPPDLRDEIGRLYQPGDSLRYSRPSDAFLIAVMRAINAVAIVEGKMTEDEGDEELRKLKRVLGTASRPRLGGHTEFD